MASSDPADMRDMVEGSCRMLIRAFRRFFSRLTDGLCGNGFPVG